MIRNSVKEGLVAHPRAWKGLHGFHQLVDQKELSGPWIDRTALCKARQNTKTRDQVQLQDFTTHYASPKPKESVYGGITSEGKTKNIGSINVNTSMEAAGVSLARALGHSDQVVESRIPNGQLIDGFFKNLRSR